MKVIKERTFSVKYLVAENTKENQEIQKIIEEVEKEKLDSNLENWIIIDNRKQLKEF